MVSATESPAPGIASALSDLAGTESDQSLLARSRAGDATAWERLIDRHLASLWAAVSVARVGAPTAERILDLVWLRLHERLDAPPAPLRPWLLNAVEDATRQILEPLRRPDPSRISSGPPQLALYP